MSQKYKLIKLYPGSPELGNIWSDDGIGEMHKLVNRDNCEVDDIYMYNSFKPSEYPEFWEEIVEKDYEIISIEPYTTKPCSEIFVIPFPNYPLRDGDRILSVKRLSDGEVFTVGDKIDSTISDLGRATELTGFKFFDDKLKVGLRDLGYYPLSTIILPKKPLFTTEDGVDIFEGDEYFELALTFKPVFREAIYKEIGRPNIFYDYGISEKKEKLNDNGRYYFSTKEAAEEYILMNKPCLSINDIMNTVYNPVKTKTSTINKLKKLIKSKT